MTDLRDRFGVEAGLSDHTTGNEVSIAAAALGAAVIERHVILDRALGGPDAAFSLDAEQFTRLVTGIRNVEAAMGRVTYELSGGQEKSKEHSRSLFVVRDIRAGEEITADNVRSIRPGFGLHPRYYDQIMGKKAKVELKRGTPMEFEYISQWDSPTEIYTPPADAHGFAKEVCPASPDAKPARKNTGRCS